MAKEEFDLAGIQELKINAYKKEYCKPAIVGKAKFAMLFHRLDLIGAKKSFIAVFFNKAAEAQVAFKTVKKEKLHLMKRTALASVTIGKGDDGKQEVTLEVVKGALAPDTIMSEGQELFTSLKMTLKVTGASEDSVDVDKGTKKEDRLDKKEERRDDKAEKQEGKAEEKAKRAAKRKQMKNGIDKMDGAIGQADPSKLDANVAKYETA
jgi:hypothetical protein